VIAVPLGLTQSSREGTFASGMKLGLMNNSILEGDAVIDPANSLEVSDFLHSVLEKRRGIVELRENVDGTVEKL
jgi:hypothetical protein